MAKKTDSKIKCDCRNCKHAGPVVNFIISCSIYNRKRSVGIRLCPHFDEGCSTK